ncbi:MAG: hypothetical protein JWM80_307 [Cyanobacteria bacterium RYN_339]|nr:hypothetical protein [Cyanobacteria bacterium RYN_339]
MQPKPPPPAPGSPEYVFKQQADRLAATLGFSSELAAGLRKEFQHLWKGAPPALMAEVAAFTQRVDALAAKVQEAQAALAGARNDNPREGLARLGRIELRGVLAAARGLEGAGAKLREDPELLAWRAPAARGTSELKRQGTGPLATAAFDLLRRFAPGLDVKELGLEPPAPPAPTAVPKDFAERRAHLLTALETMSRLLGFVGPRMGVLRTSFDLTGLPRAKKLLMEFRAECERTATAEGASAQETTLRITLGQALLLSAIAAQRSQVALVQWDDAQALREEAEVLRQTVTGLYSPSVHKALQGFNVGKLRGALIPLNNLPLSFRDVPVLKDLFPLPPQKKVAP